MSVTAADGFFRCGGGGEGGGGGDVCDEHLFPLTLSLFWDILLVANTQRIGRCLRGSWSYISLICSETVWYW